MGAKSWRVLANRIRRGQDPPFVVVDHRDPLGGRGLRERVAVAARGEEDLEGEARGVRGERDEVIACDSTSSTSPA